MTSTPNGVPEWELKRVPKGVPKGKPNEVPNGVPDDGVDGNCLFSFIIFGAVSDFLALRIDPINRFVSCS